MEEGIKQLKLSGSNHDNQTTSHLTNENSFQTIQECDSGKNSAESNVIKANVKQSGSQTEGLYNWDSKRGDTPPKESDGQVRKFVNCESNNREIA